MIGRDEIVDATLALADADHWERVRLHDVADRLGCGLGDIHVHFREKEEIVDAWLDRADVAMLAVVRDAGEPDSAFLKRLLRTWLDTLAPYRRVTREMALVRLEPGHLHHQIPSLLRISRTVQWLREALGRDQSFVARALDETACTSLCVIVFGYWIVDDSSNQRATFSLLDRLLDAGDRVRATLGR